MTFISQLLL